MTSLDLVLFAMGLASVGRVKHTVGVAVGICGMQLVRNICANLEVRFTKEHRTAGVLDNFEEVKSLDSPVWILKVLETCADKSMEFCCFLALIIFHSKIKSLSSNIDPLRGMSSSLHWNSCNLHVAYSITAARELAQMDGVRKTHITSAVTVSIRKNTS
nr:hypothetical protein CFP56_08316 [Quercus suber]